MTARAWAIWRVRASACSHAAAHGSASHLAHHRDCEAHDDALYEHAAKTETRQDVTHLRRFMRVMKAVACVRRAPGD